ncbi:MAG: phosphatidate cytidylyltransferase [Phycisphaerales bacterium]
MLKQRLILGPVMILVAFLVVWLDDAVHSMTDAKGVAFGVGISLIIMMTAWELSRILKANNVQVATPICLVSSLAGLLGTTLWTNEPRALGTLAVMVMILALLTHVRHRTIEGVVAAAGGVMLVFVYLGVQSSFWLTLCISNSPWIVLWLVLVTKSCDIGAFFTGRSLGKHKLIPWLSPGKTWEGLVGGLVTSSLICALGVYLLSLGDIPTGVGYPLALGMGAIIGLLGQLGDLTASLFKRDAGKKDSSASIPGFGGWLDVMDSLLLVGPFAYWMLRAINAS